MMSTVTKEQEAALVAELEDASPLMLYAGRPEPEPYQAVWNGKRIFDVSSDGSLLQQFRDKNRAEFGDKIVITSLSYQGHQVHLAYHKDLYQKYEESPALLEIEQQNPESFGN